MSFFGIKNCVSKFSNKGIISKRLCSSSILAGTLSVFLSFSVSANQCPSVLKHLKRKLNSQETVNFCEAYKGKAVLFVNTASYCNFTPQYDGLEALYKKYKDKGLVILGFPSHDFDQEDRDEAKIAKLCRLTYGVEFPMFEPISVRGEDADILFQQLARKTGIEPKWNFYKYLMNIDGSEIKGYSSRTKPWDPAFMEEVELALLR
ncbi:MAG: glutathione peroxidase [Alteromonadaceae bacterium]|nr:glutathione peroxidase [Alteromonadaceae bacterium]